MVKRNHFRLISLLLIAYSSLAYSQRPQQQDSPTRAELTVSVTFDNDRAVPQMYRVQLLTSGRMPVSEQFTNDRGQAQFRGLGAGGYQVVVAGLDIETSEITFVINAHESVHMEYIRVKKKPAVGEAGTSTQGSISAATLNIPDKARKEFEKGLVAFDKQDFPVARERFTKAAEIYPQYSAAYLNLGVISMKESKGEEGQHFFEQAMKVDPQNPSAYTYLARCYILNGKNADAEPLLAKAISITPFDPEPLTMLATSQLRSGKLNDAVTNARRVHTFPHEHYAVAHIIAAEALMQEHQPDMAAAEYRLFLKESPNGSGAELARTQLQSIENHPR